jgi:hypothetical protein
MPVVERECKEAATRAPVGDHLMKLALSRLSWSACRLAGIVEIAGSHVAFRGSSRE